MNIKLRVHIIPIGDDELERIIKPPLEGKADRVYFITMKGKDLYHATVNEAERLMKRDNKEVIIKYCDMADYESLLYILALIIKSEQDSHNELFLSVSTGGNMAAAAMITASMLFGGQPYFSKKNFTNNFIATPIPIPQYHISPPDPSLIRFIFEIDLYCQQNQLQNISKHECLQLMVKIQPNEPLSHTSGDYNKLKFRYLDSLQARHFIQIDSKPRGRVELTDDGRFVLHIFQKYYGIFERKN
jgi:predicted transcriptional regulator